MKILIILLIFIIGNIEETGGKTIKLPYQEYLQSQKKHAKNGWYLRIDNNGWRPVNLFIYFLINFEISLKISHKMLNKVDSIESLTAKKPKYFHYDKKKREEKNSKKMRIVYFLIYSHK